MAVKDRLPWVFAAILVACTLVALWVTAARVKGQKMAARYGEKVEAPPSLGPERLTLKTGERRQVGHFTLVGKGATLEVVDANGRALVEFTGIRKGQLRAWQELQLTFVEVAADALGVETEFRPGSPCFGSGLYRALKAGLQVRFPGGRSATITAWDPSTSEIKVHFESPGGHVQNTFGAEGKGDVFGMSYALDRDAALRIETPDAR